MRDLLSIEWDDMGRASDILLDAFSNYPMHQWIFDTEKNPQRIQRHFNRSWIYYCIKYGLALKTQSLEAVMLAKKPGDEGYSHLRNIRSGMLKIPFMVNKTTLKRMIWLNERVLEERRRIMEGQKHWYLLIMATSPDKSGQGFGHIALENMIKMAQTAKLPIYLQSSNPSAIKFYLAHGFKVSSTFSVDDTFSISTMVYENE